MNFKNFLLFTCRCCAAAVGEHFKRSEGRPARATGAFGRENVGMSNHKADAKSAPRKSKVSSVTEIGGGLDGPKAMAKAAAKGQLVNIPAPKHFCEGGTKDINLSVLMV